MTKEESFRRSQERARLDKLVHTAANNILRAAAHTVSFSDKLTQEEQDYIRGRLETYIDVDLMHRTIDVRQQLREEELKSC